MQRLQGTYNLSIASSVTDFAGNPMMQPFTSSFILSFPDLAITATSSPPSAVEDSSTLVSWTVANLSPSSPATSTWTDTVYLSSHSVLDGTAIPLLNVNEPPQSPLAANGTYTQNDPITIPGHISAGNYYLLFVTNSNSGQLVSSTANEVVADPITLMAPDLQVAAVSGPSSGYNSQEALVNWTDQNIGSAAASGSWVDNVYAATNAQGANPTLLVSFAFTSGLGSAIRCRERNRSPFRRLPALTGLRSRPTPPNHSMKARVG